MTEMEWTFLIVLIMNTVISVLYYVCGILFSKKGAYNKGSYLMNTVVMILCPVVGPMFFLCGQLAYYIFFKQDVDLEDVIFSKNRVKTQVRADAEREGNLVPIEEALAICDKDSLRTLVMNVVRGDIQNLLASIALALNSEDTETSHYAATVLRDALNDFRQRAQELYNAMKKLDEENKKEEAGEYAKLLLEYMNGVLCQNVFHDMEQRTYVEMMETAAGYLYENAGESLSSQYIEWICLRLLKIEEFDKMKQWCLRSVELYPENLSTFTCQLKLYFTIQDKVNFFDVLEKLKHSDIVLDQETLALVRTFA